MNQRKIIQGENISVVSLLPEELISYANFDSNIETVLNAKYGIPCLDLGTKTSIIDRLIPRIQHDRENWIYHTVWLIVILSSKQICGAICFKGKPDDLGAVEIGAAMFAPFENKGIMTEATKLLVNWGFNQANIRFIRAAARIDNSASHKVLLKSGFKMIYQNKEEICFEIKKT